ncbi:MAG: AzlC family ABC transporter permease [Clostridia bacterium]|nr:AzlC family ABC transporter permease [Clostridia bacterium]
MMDETGKKYTAHDYKRALQAAFPHTIPVLTGFAVLGMAYGVLMATNGYGVLWSALMSAIGFGGSVQYAMVPLLTTVFDPAQAFLLSLMINARHLFYGLSMLDKYKGLGKVRAFLIYVLCDETFSIVSSVEPPKEADRKLFYFFVSLLDYLYWITAAIVGAVLGGMITFDTTGLDFVLTALFVVLFMEQMKNHENYRYGVIGILASVAAVMLFGADNMVIPSMIMILVILLAGRKLEDRYGDAGSKR